MANINNCLLLFIFSQISIVFLQDVSSDPYRLPKILSPQHYEVHLNITSDAFSAGASYYDGAVLINFLVLENTTEIVLHSSSNFIELRTITLNNQLIPESSYSVNTTTDILSIDYGETLIIGRTYSLLIEFVGRLSVSDMYGWYKSSYVDSEGVTKYLATTQFQTTYARRAFPCWDEPSFKATFIIILTYPSELNALSNTPGTLRINDTANGLLTTEFEITPIMSTYLIAFIVSDFTCTSGESVDEVPTRVCSRPETADIREWSVDIAPKILSALNEYTAYNYKASLSKMDQVAIPDFASGAMENWGLVTYRETGLLWDPLESATSYRQSIAAVIAHEFTHMWFGNLVTCNWWSETFLNEGFARLLQYTILQEVLPDWDLVKQFVVVVLQGIMESDSYLTALPLQSPASTPSEVSAKFGTISYSKGASVIRMVDNLMGSENFRAGIRNYLANHAYQSTLPEDLWSSLGESVNDTVSFLPADLNTVMANWVKVSGFPLLTVTRNGNSVSITQQRFLLSGVDRVTKWYVPVSYTTSDDTSAFEVTTPSGWLTPESDLEITLPSDAEWIILNNYETGYYRVTYDDELWSNISQALLAANFSNIPEVNRAQIIDDVFNLAKIDKLAYSKLFEIIQFLHDDDSYFSWYPAFTGFNYLFRRLGKESALGQAISAHLYHLMDTLSQSVSMTYFNETEHIYTLKQVLTINWASSLGKEEYVSAVREAFKEFRENGTSPHKNLKSIVYCNGLRYSEDSSDWEFLWRTYLNTELATERAVLITALGCSKDRDTLKQYLLKSINSTSGIRSQDAYSVFAAVYGNDLGVDVAFNFLIEYYEEINDYYQSMNSVANILSGIASRFTNAEQVAKLENFISTGNLSESFILAANDALASAKANIDWIDDYKLDLMRYYSIEEEVEVDENESSQPQYRLSYIFQPSHYEIYLNVSRDAFTASGNTFTGTAIIYFKVTTSTARILLHASYENIQIQTIQLNNQDIPDTDYSVNSTTDILRIEYESGLRSNTLYALTIQYQGTFGRSLTGFYKSSYTVDNETRYLLTTQFEPTHARRAFPCFDEPAFKASFQIIITYPSEYKAWSNTLGEVISSLSNNDTTTYQFHTTPVTPTYLIAFVVSDFTCTAGESAGTAPYQVCSRDDEIENRALAVELGPKILNSLSSFTGYQYSDAIEKMDQFAIPDFSSGAMENWGLVTYREYYLLWDPLESTNAYKQSVATIIAHEFGHQWFGNLVTCSWWSEIFLNEGFATYTEFFTTHDVLPDWQLDKQFVVRVHQPILSTDSYLTSQALQSPASTPTQISNKFGSISYSKGGSILRMVEHILGSENFRAGVQHYLKANEFGNAKPEQLWSALSEHVDSTISRLPADLETVMENWIKKSGFPILQVGRFGNSIIISQQRFLISGEDNESKWYVPISYTTSVDENKFESTSPQAWLTPSYPTLALPYPNGAEWIILNNQETAFYRVNYTEELWDGLKAALLAQNFSGIPELNRAQIADDIFEYTKYDKITFTQAFTILEFLENDDSYITWYSVNTEFTSLMEKVGLHTRLGKAMQEHVVRLIGKLYDSAPANVVDEDDQLYTLRQILAVNLACKLHHTGCGRDIKEHFANFVDNGALPPKNIRSVVYCNGLRHNGTKEEWQHILSQYEVADSSTDRSSFLTALGCITDPEILTEYLKLSITSGSPVYGSPLSVFSVVYANPTGVEIAFNFFKENQQAIYNHFGSWATTGQLLIAIASRFRSQEDVDALRKYVTSDEILGNLVSYGNTALNSAESSLAWVNTYRQDFYNYYGLEDDPTSTTTTTTESPTDAPTTPAGASSFSSSLLLTIVAILIQKYCFN